MPFKLSTLLTTLALLLLLTTRSWSGWKNDYDASTVPSVRSIKTSGAVKSLARACTPTLLRG
jgi:hypothetical protein